MNDIIFEKQQGGLTRPLAGEDHYSGLLFYSTPKPTGWATQSVRRVTSPEHAVTLGIAMDSANFGVMYYQIAEAFRINPGIVLFIGIFTAPVGGLDFTEVKIMQRFADGKLRQIGVFLTTAFDADDTTILQGIFVDLFEEHMPIEILLTADFKAVADLTTLADLRAMENPDVSVIIGQDGANKGAALYVSSGKSVCSLGTALGTASLAKVHECIAWVEKFNVAEVELDVPAFGNGQLIKTCDPGLLDAVNTKGYIFLKKHVGKAGSFFNDSHTCVGVDSDYAYLENNRVMNKAIRGVRAKVLPQLNGPVYIDPTSGKLDHTTVKYIEDLANQHLVQMARDGELSGYKAAVDPDQDVLATSEVEIKIVNVPVGVSRKIRIKIGFGKKI